MKTLGILYNDKDGIFKKYPFKHDYTFQAYKIFSEIAFRNSLKTVVAKPEWYKRRKLSLCWNLLSQKLEKNVGVDFIFDRCLSPNKKHYLFMKNLREKIKHSVKVLNNSFVEDVCNDKYLTYLFLKRHVPTTVLSLKKIGEIKSDTVVVKPRFGAGGRGVYIQGKDSVKILKRDFLLQEFVDTSSGVKGLVKGTHDLRLVILSGKILDFYIRMPRKGLISNISLGGRFVKVDRIPASAKRMGRCVDKKLRKFYPRFYSVDLLFDKYQRSWICELNAHPGLDVYHEVGEGIEKYEKICEEIINSINSCL